MAGARRIASSSAIPDRSAGSTRLGSSVRASAPASIHGRRCGGVAITAVSLTIAIGLSSWSTITTARAWFSSARLIASASGVFAATETALRASRLACSAGSRSRNLVALMACPAPVHMKAAITASHTTVTMSPPVPVHRAGNERHHEQAHGDHPARPGGGDGRRATGGR